MSVVRTIVVIGVVAFALDRLNVPAGALIGAMAAAIFLNLSGAGTTPLPEWARFASFAAIGWVLGEGFTRDSLATLRSALVPVIVVVVTLVVTGVLLAYVLRWLGVDSATAFLSASPGGISQMAALSADTGANAPVVAVTHLVRIIAVISLAPLLFRLFGDS
jgi:hypothetical protein